MIIIFRDYLRSHTDARDRYNQKKEEILAKVGSENRAGYVQMKEEEYGDFFEEIIKRAEDEASNWVNFSYSTDLTIIPFS